MQQTSNRSRVAQLALRPAVQASIGLAVVAVAFIWALPRFAAYDQVWEQLTGLRGAVIPALLIVGAANLVAPSISQQAALPGLKLGQAVTTDWATTTVTNLLPGGSALAIGLTWSMYRSFKLTTEAITRSIVVTGVWDAFVKLGTPLVAIIWLATQRPVGAALIQAAVLGGILFAVAAGLMAVVLSGAKTAASIGRRLDALPLLGDGWPERLDDLRTETVALLAGRWRSLTFWTVAGHLNLYLLLVVCLRALGVERSVLGWAPVLAAFAFGRLVTAIPITPGGLGVMELGLVSALGAVGDAPEASVVAAVLLFRFMTFALPIPLGLISWLWWTARRDRLASRGSTAAEAAGQQT
ncbi:MAG: lysylphosphatidylglycerol synthase transmembrane domain-containing protein [Acidimicrobiales bacterium]